MTFATLLKLRENRPSRRDSAPFNVHHYLGKVNIYHELDSINLCVLARILRSYPSRSLLHSFAALRLSGLSQFGSRSIDMTLTTIVSTVWIGSHRSWQSSYSSGSFPGSWRIEMQTSPVFSWMFGCHIGQINLIFGGRTGNSGGKTRMAGKTPPSYGDFSGPMMSHRHWNGSLFTKLHEK